MARTTLTLHDDIMKRLVKMRGTMEHQNGERRCLEDVIIELMNFFEKHKEQKT